jgi:predicted PurR-regulated permease PerM
MVGHGGGSKSVGSAQARAGRPVQQIHSTRKARYVPSIDDAQPVAHVRRIWSAAGRAATIGIFLFLFGAALYFGRAILMPALGAAVVATTFAPLVRRAKRLGIPPWVTALFVVALFGAVVAAAATLMADPVSKWIARAPDIEATVKQAFSVLDKPIAALRSLESSLMGGASPAQSVAASPPNVIIPVIAFVTPAAAELILFFVALVFMLAGQIEMHATLAMMFASREGRLRYLKIVRDIEYNLASYLLVVTCVNAVLGMVVATGAWLLGLPNPAVFGMLAAILNYIPYVGPAVMAMVLFGVGLVTFSSLAHALVAPLFLVVLASLEGHLITPTIVGRRFTLNPLMVVLALAFWSWLWGPVGAFFAVPISIVCLVIHDHLFGQDDAVPIDWPAAAQRER